LPRLADFDLSTGYSVVDLQAAAVMDLRRISGSNNGKPLGGFGGEINIFFRMGHTQFSMEHHFVQT
jgi:hypothetical protein